MSQCPQCGTPTQPGQPFCGVCGSNLAAPASEQTVIRPAAPPTPPAEQVQPTAQFPTVPPQQPWGAPPPPQQDWQQQGPPQQGWPAPPPQQGWQAPPPPQQGWQHGAPPYGAPQYGAPPYGAPPYGAPPRQPSVDLSWLLKGNWVGAATVALAAFGVALVLGLVVAFAGADDLDVPSAIWTGLILTAGAFGANTIVDYSDQPGVDDGFQSYGQYPLLATVLALGLAVHLFRRTTKGYTDVKAALLDAVRAGLILTVLTTVLAIITKIVKPEVEGYADEPDVFGLLIPNGDSSASVGGALLLPFLLLTTVLALACLIRRDWLGQKLAAVHDWVAAPLAGFTVIVVALLAAGLVWVIAQIAGEEDARGFAEVIRLLAVLPAAGVHLIGLGSLGTIGSKTESDDEGDDEKDWDRLWDFADDHGAVFWIAPVVAIAIAALGVWAVARRTPDRTKVLRNVGVYLGLLLFLVVPFLVRFANLHFKQEIEADGESYDASAVAGLDGFQTTLLFVLLSVVVGAIVLAATGSIDVNALKAKAASLQSNPNGGGAWGPQGQQQWGQQPPPPPGQQQWGQQPPPPPGQQQWGQQPPPPPQWAPPPPAQGEPPQQNWQPPAPPQQ